jgi:photosystem II stability/assembly factor-like uncharacterized protein
MRYALAFLMVPSVAVLLAPSGPATASRATGVSPAAERVTVDPAFLHALEWRSLGPFRGGRTVAVVGDSRDPLVFYFGSAHGGVWKTTDAGTYWRNVSDGFFKTAPVGAIDVSLSNPAVVYVGMGESLNRQDITPGDGVYKSTDGGRTWTNVGLAETRHIAKIRIHPTNPDIVYVAAAGDLFGSNPERGVYRTKDGGKTWQRVLYKSDRANALDLVIDPTNPSVLYASLDQLQRLPWDDVSGGPDSGLYKTTDGGDTWTDLTRNPGLPRGVIGKIGLALSPPRPNRIWALIEAEDGALFRSDDSGSTWERINDKRDLRRSASSYMHIVADTQDPETLYLPTYEFQKSTDGGKTFRTEPMAHGDHHALWIDPNNSKRMIGGNDGGATITLNGGASWSTQHNQPTADLFSLAIDAQDPYWLYGAQNDNTHIAVPSRTSEGAIAWRDNKPLPGGEGGQTAVRPDGSVVYAADRAEIHRYDRRTGQAANISVWPEDEFTFVVKDVKFRFYYTIPILLSPHDSKVLYAGANRLFRTSDEGNSWDAISPDLTRNRQDKMQKIPGGPISSMWSSLYWVSVIQAVAEAPQQKGELWVGTDDSTVQMTRDSGKSWENVSPKDMGEWTTITNIEVSPHDRGTVYLAANRYRVSDRTPYFFKTTDYGRTWQKITTGIRENDFAWVVREDPVRRGLLYAGTETGAYISFDGGDSWQALQRHLPAVQVRNMLVKGNDLVVGTHGRGFWIMDNLTALRQITPVVTAAPAHLFDIVPVNRYLPIQVLSPRRPVRAGIEFARSGDTVAYEDQAGPDGLVKRVFLNAGENPSGGLTIDYSLKSPSAAATLSLLDSQGQVIRHFSSQAKDSSWMPADAGMNRFVWDLRYPGPREIPAPTGFVSAEYPRAQAPVAPPGRYTARLMVAGQQSERSFEIRRDARLTATDEDLKAQFVLMVQIRDRLSAITDAVDRLRKARQQLNDRKRADASDGALASARQKLQAIESALTRLPGPSPHVLPPKALNNRLAALSGDVQQADGRPTRQMAAVFEELSGLVAEQFRRLDEVLNDVRALTSASGVQH